MAYFVVTRRMVVEADDEQHAAEQAAANATADQVAFEVLRENSPPVRIVVALKSERSGVAQSPSEPTVPSVDPTFSAGNDGHRGFTQEKSSVVAMAIAGAVGFITGIALAGISLIVWLG